MNAHPAPVKMEEGVMNMLMATHVHVLMDTQEFTVKQVGRDQMMFLSSAFKVVLSNFYDMIKLFSPTSPANPNTYEVICFTC